MNIKYSQLKIIKDAIRVFKLYREKQHLPETSMDRRLIQAEKCLKEINETKSDYIPKAVIEGKIKEFRLRKDALINDEDYGLELAHCEASMDLLTELLNENK